MNATAVSDPEKSNYQPLEPASAEQTLNATWMPATTNSAPTAVELCCGMGAIGLGLRSLGFHIAHAYDCWDDAVAIYNSNAPEPVAESCDLLARGSVQRLRDQCRKLSGIDLTCGWAPV